MKVENAIALIGIALLILLAVDGIVSMLTTTSPVQAYGTRCDAIDVSRSSLALKLNEINGKNPVFMDVEVRSMTANPVCTISYCW